ncbi:Rho GTPase activation protein [Heliocybe sulcata]|uniref:Rho GTPase activation protein n=1 Tax=Heliocybe sulcata TaxID=5364 RepID=A0A5C3NJP6_9AGAM|nr:Rho GTPase activation protein [Heliocybe sulcata]
MEDDRREMKKEFFVSVELFVSNRAAVGLRKPPPQTSRKKDGKRESIRPTFGPSDDPQKKLKEKSSWLTLSRNATSSGSWRPALCKLTEEDEGCLMNVYVDETTLHQTVYVHQLNHTDIRHADRSLFYRRDCTFPPLTRIVSSGQRWSVLPSNEPLYLHFPSTETANTWITLLRSYATPEIYGSYFSPSDGGLYRMWRQVELTVVQGRNLGQSKLYENVVGGTETEVEVEAEGTDMDVYCEVYINDILSGRTTTKRCPGSTDWHEAFAFCDLPPFGNLEILVLREKKLTKPIPLGNIKLFVSDFRRGEAVEGWFPVLFGDAGVPSTHIGDLRLKLKVDEEIILPLSAYSDLLEMLYSRNCLDWMNDLDGRLQLTPLSSQVLSISIARNILLDHIFELADREVDGTPNSHNTLFRGNTVLTKTMEMSMAWYGRGFLEASIGPVIRRLHAERITIEIDPVRSAGKSAKDIDRNVDQLVYWCQEVWNSIYSTRGECPLEMRRLFAHIRQLVENRYQVKDIPNDKGRELPWQSVSAFCFLRFFVPAILHPHLFGLCPGLPEGPVQRSLTLIAKVIQSLANLNAAVQREEFMKGVKNFLSTSLPAMIDYILVVSTLETEKVRGPYGYSQERHERLHVMNSVQQRGPSMPLLHREAIPLLPHLLDIPRHLAIITSAVIRHSRSVARSTSTNAEEGPLDTFYARCFEVEQRALLRVSHLAARQKPSMNRRPSTSASVSVSSGEPGMAKSKRGSRKLSRASRPATAPSFNDNSSDGRRSRAPSSATSDISLPSSPVRNRHSTHGDMLSQEVSEIDLSSDYPPSPTAPLSSMYRVMSEDSMSRNGPYSTDGPEDPGRKKKGLLRGILTRH